MEKKVAGFIVAPMWNEFMQFALTKKSPSAFTSPEGISSDIKPIIAGNWQYTNDGMIHTILHWVDRNNPLGGQPRNPNSDSQYWLWENAVRAWQGNSPLENNNEENSSEPNLQIINPANGDVFLKETEVYVAIQLNNTSTQLKEGVVKINGIQEGKIDTNTKSFSFFPEKLDTIKTSGNLLEVEVEDVDGNKYKDSIVFGTK